MIDLLYLTREQVAGLLPSIDEQLDLVETTYRAAASGNIELPPKPGIHPREDSFIHAMPAYLRDDDIAVLKWVSGYPDNKKRGLPYISGLIVLNDPETGLPLTIMDGAEITAARTAAASGVCVRRFAPPGWSRAAILGCGEQGRYHARVLNVLNPDVELAAYDPHPERIDQLEGRVRAAASAQQATQGAGVVVSAGPIVKEPPSPLVPDWLGSRWLALPIDFDFYFAPESIASADLVLSDDLAQFEYYRTQGHFQGWPKPHGSVGEFLAEPDQPARVACVNLGVGALDGAFAAYVDARARQDRIGTSLGR